MCVDFSEEFSVYLGFLKKTRSYDETNCHVFIPVIFETVSKCLHVYLKASYIQNQKTVCIPFEVFKAVY